MEACCPVELPDDPVLLKDKIHSLEVKNALLEERIRQLIQKRFGASSEKCSPDQVNLFDEAEQEQQAEEENDNGQSDEITVPSHTRKKVGRKPLPDHLPRIRQEHDIPENEKVCSCCQGTLHRMGEEISEQLDIIPAKVQVIQHIRPKYACRTCENRVKTATLPPQPIPRSIATSGLLAYIVTSKYVDGLPLYRLEQFTLARLGVEITRATMATWMIRCGELVQPLINLLRDKLLEAPVVHCDETVVQVLNEPDKTPQSKSYMWVQVAELQENQRIILFDYAASRSGSVPVKLLEGFQGYLQTDGYEGYAAIGRQPGITSQGCWAHARRKFDEAVKGQKDPKKTGKAHAGLALIQKLYRIEREIKENPPDDKKRIRQQKSMPVLNKLRQWLERSLPQAPPKSLLGKALHYLHNQWDKLVRYCDEGYLRMDNNLAENAIRPFVVGRKAWLFSNSQKGARASANLYSLVETAKACGLEPYTYLKEVFARLPAVKTVDDIEQLLPWNINPA